MKNICINPRFLLSIEHPLEYQVRRGLYLAIGVTIALYIYFVGSSVFNVMAKTEAETNTRALHDAIASLEGNYFTLSQAITPEAAASLGLVATVATYVRPMESTAYAR